MTQGQKHHSALYFQHLQRELDKCWSWKFKRKGLLCSQNLHTESKTNCHKCNFKSLNIHSWLWTPAHIGTLFLLVVWNGQGLGEYNWHEEERFLKKFPSSAVTRSRLKWFRKRTSARGPEQSLFKGSIAPRIHQLTNMQEKMCLVRYEFSLCHWARKWKAVCQFAMRLQTPGGKRVCFSPPSVHIADTTFWMC